MPEFRIPNVIPVNDHVWLLDDNHDATCYVVAGTKLAAVIDTSLGMSNIRAVAEALTPLPLICISAVIFPFSTVSEQLSIVNMEELLSTFTS